MKYISFNADLRQEPNNLKRFDKVTFKVKDDTHQPLNICKSV